MKRIILIFIPFLLFSCSLPRLIMVSYEYQNFEINETLTATVGSVMIELETGQKAEGEDKSKELTSIQKSYQAWKKGFSQELIYNGRAGNIINITYREYSVESYKKYIRNDFTEKLQYDIGESNIISFRALKIEIIEANSNLIRFKVLEWKTE